MIEMLLDVEIRKFVDQETCLYWWQHVAASGDETVV